MSEGRFRTALNGFNRQDVAAYIEGMAQRSKAVKEERDSLEQQLGDLSRTAEAAAEKQKELESALAARESDLREAEARKEGGGGGEERKAGGAAGDFAGRLPGSGCLCPGDGRASGEERRPGG